MAFVIGGAIAASAATQYLGSQAAANTQAGAARDATDAQVGMFNTQMSNLKPYYDAGYGALKDIQTNMPQWNKPFSMEDFYANKDPGYQFRLDQGINAAQKSAAASGSNVGTSQLAAVNNYAQGSASQEYGNAFNRYQTGINNAFNRLASVAQIGQTSTNIGTQAGTAAATNVGQGISSIGNAQAAGQVGGANAITSSIGQGINAYQTSQLMDVLKTNQNANASGGDLAALRA